MPYVDPEGYRTLCMNCNFSLGHNGYCPHGLQGVSRAGRPVKDPGRAVRYRQRKHDYNQELKHAVFDAYGGPRCVCCGEEHIEFPQIDHIGGTGAEHRRSLPGKSPSRSMYVWLRQNGFPPGFQVLCANCNFAAGRANNHGICPHQAPRL